MKFTALFNTSRPYTIELMITREPITERHLLAPQLIVLSCSASSDAVQQFIAVVHAQCFVCLFVFCSLYPDNCVSEALYGLVRANSGEANTDELCERDIIYFLLDAAVCDRHSLYVLFSLSSPTKQPVRFYLPVFFLSFSINPPRMSCLPGVLFCFSFFSLVFFCLAEQGGLRSISSSHLLSISSLRFPPS